MTGGTDFMVVYKDTLSSRKFLCPAEDVRRTDACWRTRLTKFFNSKIQSKTIKMKN